jgi:hypothetical protein
MLAADNPVRCLILEAPFTSAADVGAQHYWFVPVRLLMRDQFHSDLFIGKVRAPVLVVHGENDTIVPVSLGERLYSLARMPPCGLFVTRGREPIAVIGELGPETVASLTKGVPNLGPRLSVVSAKGETLAHLGTEPIGEGLGQFIAPHGIGLDSRGMLGAPSPTEKRRSVGIGRASASWLSETHSLGGARAVTSLLGPTEAQFLGAAVHSQCVISPNVDQGVLAPGST